MQARLSYSQIPAEMKRVYHVEAFRPPGCVLQGPPTLPVSPETQELRVTSPSADRRFFRQPGAGAAGTSDIHAIGFSHRAVETIRPSLDPATLPQNRACIPVSFASKLFGAIRAG